MRLYASYQSSQSHWWTSSLKRRYPASTTWSFRPPLQLSSLGSSSHSNWKLIKLEDRHRKIVPWRITSWRRNLKRVERDKGYTMTGPVRGPGQGREGEGSLVRHHPSASRCEHHRPNLVEEPQLTRGRQRLPHYVYPKKSTTFGPGGHGWSLRRSHFQCLRRPRWRLSQLPPLGAPNLRRHISPAYVSGVYRADQAAHYLQSFSARDRLDLRTIPRPRSARTRAIGCPSSSCGCLGGNATDCRYGTSCQHRRTSGIMPPVLLDPLTACPRAKIMETSDLEARSDT